MKSIRHDRMAETSRRSIARSIAKSRPCRRTLSSVQECDVVSRFSVALVPRYVLTIPSLSQLHPFGLENHDDAQNKDDHAADQFEPSSLPLLQFSVGKCRHDDC